jgi:transcriptional regulator with XRE-family HTH domain
MAKTLGERIRAKREQLGLSQQDCADQLDCTRAMISLIEQDKIEPRRPTIADRLAELLGVSE